MVISSCSTITTLSDLELTLTPEPTPIIKTFYYGRSLLSLDNQKAYDFILSQIWIWEDNANELGTIAPLKLISLQEQDFKITKKDLALLLMYMRNDVHALYTQYPTTRYTVLDAQGYVTSFQYRHTNFPKYNEYKKSIIQINQKANEIISKMPKNLTDAQKVRFIHDNLLDMVSYGGMNSTSSDDIRGAFIDFKIICDGYARAFAFLLQKLGIDVVYIVGYAGVGEQSNWGYHAWNKVRIEDEWYNVDPTWNDPIGSGIGAQHDYFLMGDTEFNKTHILDVGQFFYPMPESSLTDYPFEKTHYYKTSIRIHADGNNL